MCRSVHLVSHLERSSEVVWCRLPSSPGRCYTVVASTDYLGVKDYNDRITKCYNYYRAK